MNQKRFSLMIGFSSSYFVNMKKVKKWTMADLNINQESPVILTYSFSLFCLQWWGSMAAPSPTRLHPKSEEKENEEKASDLKTGRRRVGTWKWWTKKKQKARGEGGGGGPHGTVKLTLIHMWSSHRAKDLTWTSQHLWATVLTLHPCIRSPTWSISVPGHDL